MLGSSCFPEFSLEFLKRCPNSHRFAVGAVGGHGVEGVAGEDDTVGERYMLTREVVGITLAVPTLVLGPDLTVFLLTLIPSRMLGYSFVRLPLEM